MRRTQREFLVLLTALSATGPGCGDADKTGSLAQVGEDARPRPVADGSVADATEVEDTVVADTSAPEVEVAPVACTTDRECVATTCTVGRCVADNCVFDAAPPNTPCDDGDPCTLVDTCVATACAGSGLLTCDDQDPCTDDRCSPGIGCAFAAKTCDDGDACTTDTCTAQSGCLATPISCPSSGDNCRPSTCDPAVGCTTGIADDGTACDDGRICTIDACVAGKCEGTATGCDDHNPCTQDQCLPEGGCDFVPIQGCANDDECLGRLSGARCDDADGGTTADMCIAGNCRGYSLTRIAGTSVDGQQGLVVRELDDGPEGWSAVFWTADFLGGQSFLLANVTNPAAPVQHANTLQDARIAGLRDGLAGDSDGHLWRLDGGQWSSDGVWDDAIAASGRGVINAIFTVQGAGINDARTRLAWVVGGDDGEWLRLCRQSGGNVVCSAQILGGADGSVPRAIGGIPKCNGSGDCNGASVVLGADAFLGGGFNYNDTYENPTGIAATWQPGNVPDAPANRATRAIAVWDDGGVHALVVGDNGYVLLRRVDGSWRTVLGLADGQASRDFSGVWVGASVVIASAHRLGSNNAVVYELWVAPSDSDLENGNSWVVHELGRYPDVAAAGLYDVAGKTEGEVRVVGAVRRSNDLFDWLDGAVWVRSP